jgi:hypothetical protein
MPYWWADLLRRRGPTKGYLVVRRNQVRDYLDVAALSDRYEIPHSADVLGHIDVYYSDQRGPESEGVATQPANGSDTLAMAQIRWQNASA